MKLNSILMQTIVTDYETLYNSIGTLIDSSGFKNSFLARKIGVSQSNFSMKKKRNSWTLHEIKQILQLIDSEEMSDLVLAKIMESRQDEETISFTDLKNQMGWK